jgi:hypothetical protein
MKWVKDQLLLQSIIYTWKQNLGIYIVYVITTWYKYEGALISP